MDKTNTQKIRIEHHPLLGLGWVAAWLFTIGFLHLSFWRSVLAILLWAYYLGVHFSALAR
jgi:uncharacterized membrane protein